MGPRFQPDADASSLYFASVSCTSASLRECAIRARDYNNPPQHLRPYFAANPQLAAQEGASQ